MDNTFEINNKLFLQGNFMGKYESKTSYTNGNATFSNINILKGTLTNLNICSFNNLFNVGSNSLFHEETFDVEVKIDDKLLKDKYIFIEEISNSTIYDIKLSDHLKEENKNFGVIKGKLICYLDDTYEFDMYHDKSYIVSKEIDFEDPNIIEIAINRTIDFCKKNLNPIKWYKCLLNKFFNKK